MLSSHEHEMRFFAKHCLFIHCREAHIASGQSAPLLTSGFVISIDDEWFFITAGHCLTKIEEKKNAGVIYSEWSLVDGFALSKPRPHNIDAPAPIDTIPFDFENSYKVYVFDQDKGIDCGFIHLEKPKYRRLLEANGIDPFEGLNCRIPKEMAIDCDKYEVFGIPGDQFKDLGNGSFYANLVGVTLERLDLSAPEWQKQPNMFHASFPADFSRYGPDGFKDFKGLSGGPIIGTKFLEDGERYCVVAIQSGWDKKSKITASYLFPLTIHIDQLVKRVRSHLEQRG